MEDSNQPISNEQSKAETSREFQPLLTKYFIIGNRTKKEQSIDKLDNIFLNVKKIATIPTQKIAFACEKYLPAKYSYYSGKRFRSNDLVEIRSKNTKNKSAWQQMRDDYLRSGLDSNGNSYKNPNIEDDSDISDEELMNKIKTDRAKLTIPFIQKFMVEALTNQEELLFTALNIIDEIFKKLLNINFSRKKMIFQTRAINNNAHIYLYTGIHQVVSKDSDGERATEIYKDSDIPCFSIVVDYAFACPENDTNQAYLESCEVDFYVTEHYSQDKQSDLLTVDIISSILQNFDSYLFPHSNDITSLDALQSYLTNLSMQIGRISYLNLTDCPTINEEAISYIANNYPNIEELILNGNSQIKAFAGSEGKALVFPKLHTLSCAGCVSLEYISIDAPLLLTLNLNLTKIDLKKSKLNCPSIIKLCLDGVDSLQDIDIYFLINKYQALKTITFNDSQHVNEFRFAFGYSVESDLKLPFNSLKKQLENIPHSSKQDLATAVFNSAWKKDPFELIKKLQTIIIDIYEIKIYYAQLPEDFKPIFKEAVNLLRTKAVDNLLNNAKEMKLSKLHVAVIKSDYEAVSQLIKNETDVNMRDAEGRMPLHYALMLGNYQITVLLLLSGAIFDIDYSNLTPLDYGIMYATNPAFTELEQQTPTQLQPYREKTNKNLPTIAVDEIKNLPVSRDLAIGYLIEHARTNTPLHIALAINDTELFTIIKDTNMYSLFTVNKLNQSLLHLALDEKVVTLLIQNNIPINQIDANNFTPLDCAVMAGKGGIIKLLTSNNAKTSETLTLAKTKADKGAITKLSKTDEKTLTYSFAQITYELNAESPIDLSPITKDPAFGSSAIKLPENTPATVTNRQTILIDILKNQFKAESIQTIDVTKRDHNNRTPLHYVAMLGLLDETKLLLSRGANPKATDQFGYQPISYATFYRHTNLIMPLITNIYDNIIQFLVENNSERLLQLIMLSNLAPVTLCDERGRTPLHKVRSYSLANMLIEHGADVNSKDINGQTPIFFAVTKNYIDITKLLIKHNADYTLVDNLSNSLLHYAISVEMTTLLINNQVNMNIRNKELQTPLHHLIMCKHYAAAELLIKKGANLLVMDMQRASPVHYIITAIQDNLTRPISDKAITPDKLLHTSNEANGWTPIKIVLVSLTLGVIKKTPDNIKLIDDLIHLLIINGHIPKDETNANFQLLKEYWPQKFKTFDQIMASKKPFPSTLRTSKQFQ